MITTPYFSPNQLPPDDSFAYKISFAEMVYMFALGAAVGFFAPAIGSLLAAAVIAPLACGGQQFAVCAQGGSIAFSIAVVIASLGALITLINKQTYQPLLNVTAPFAALWGVQQFLLPLSKENAIAYYVISAFLFALCYVLFYLLLRIKHFWISFAAIVLLIIAIRLQL